jgi:undecaprenyl-diphosphatase
VDWRVYHAIYSLSLDHHALGTVFDGIERASIPFMIAATALLWFLAPPGGDRKWKLACGSAYASAVLALLVNVVLHTIWDRPRPYETHDIRHPWATSTDASFPSDHASASLAIAFAVLAFDAVAGAVLLVAAVLIAAGRLFIGAHYPGDVGTSVIVAAASAFVVVRFARPFVVAVVRLVERVSDPLLRSLRGAAPRARR